MDSMKTLMMGVLLGAMVPGVRAQATGAAQQVRKTAEQAAAQASGQAAKPAGPSPAATNAAAAKPQTNPKTQAQVSAKPNPQAGKPASAAAKAAAPKGATAAGAKPAAKTQSAKAAGGAPRRKPAGKRAAKTGTLDTDTLVQRESKVARRDPFEAMIGRTQTATIGTAVLPPGIHGLQVSTLRLDGVVRAPNGMIAVVSNPQSRTYFLREGDQLYDGRVEKIAMDGVSFHEVGKDAFGKPVERQVNKRIYASAGEQQ